MKQFAIATFLGVAMSAEVENFRYRLQQPAPFSHLPPHIASPHAIKGGDIERQLPQEARGGQS